MSLYSLENMSVRNLVACHVFNGKYLYMKDLSTLESCRSAEGRAPIDTDLSFSPLALRIRSWTRELATHPDASFRDYILDGLGNGFRIGCGLFELLADPSRRNMSSATANIKVVAVATLILIPSTKRVYQSSQSRYIRFCNQMSLAPFSVTERTLCLFASSLAEQKSRHKTIKCYLSVVHHLHIQSGLGDPFAALLSQLSYVLRGIQRLEVSSARLPRLLIMLVELKPLKSAWSKWRSRRDASILWAACCTGFFECSRKQTHSVAAPTCFWITLITTSARFRRCWPT